MPSCTFCKNTLTPGTGKMFVFSSGKISYFCSRKCEMNSLKLRRKPAHFKWTNAYQKGVKAKEKEVVKEIVAEKKEE